MSLGSRAIRSFWKGTRRADKVILLSNGDQSSASLVILSRWPLRLRLWRELGEDWISETNDSEAWARDTRRDSDICSSKANGSMMETVSELNCTCSLTVGEIKERRCNNATSLNQSALAVVARACKREELEATSFRSSRLRARLAASLIIILCTLQRCPCAA